MDEQQSHALREMALWVRNIGLVEIRRALAICAEEANQSEDSTELAHRLLDRANGVTPEASIDPPLSSKATSTSSRKRPAPPPSAE